MSGAPANEKGSKAGARARARDRLAAVGFIAALVSHRARNRLAALRGGLELVQAGLERNLSQEHRDLLLREFDDFAGDFNLGVEMMRGDFGALSPFSVRELVEEAAQSFRPYASRNGIGLTVVCGHAADRLRADRSLLRLALLNLLRNAAQALGRTAAPAITVRTADEKGGLLLEVADNGPGVPPELCDRLFLEPAPGVDGPGLGLILCRDAMTLMGGSIRHMPAAGRSGACFEIRLPAGS